MKYLFVLLLIGACSSPQKKTETKYDAQMVCKLASLEFPNTLKKSIPKRSPEEVNAIKEAFTVKLSGFQACVNEEAKRTEEVDVMSLCYVVGTNETGKTIYSKFYSHDDKKFTKEFFACLDANRPELSSFKSIKVTQPITLRAK